MASPFSQDGLVLVLFLLISLLSQQNTPEHDPSPSMRRRTGMFIFVSVSTAKWAPASPARSLPPARRHHSRSYEFPCSPDVAVTKSPDEYLSNTNTTPPCRITSTF
ncbi:hypothetical protein M440DRAFT_367342 [Trichoderma longibrachiatum ATCC 18648]|uniref:Secreted protein n=1 Tax=Trichoderma longibrachiatum ATCC 18648 TaxID=983965 RepID=A0A2T4BQE7_TRILO|nr:hypothetical protein M440DRAFT_367342 [Trichoderma longibrachiatum ATCC 18648]